MSPAPVTRSKGGWRRKPRRVTPFVIENYWPGNKRVAALRRHWASHKPWWEILDIINRFPAPKPVTRWQCWLMASHLNLRRPPGIGRITAINAAIGPETLALRVRKRGPAPAKLFMYEPPIPESAKKLRKVGRKPKPRRRKTPVKAWATGLSMRKKPKTVAEGRKRHKSKRGRGRKARRTAVRGKSSPSVPSRPEAAPRIQP